MIEEKHEQQLNSGLEDWEREMADKQKPFDFIKIDFIVDAREAERRYKEEYKNDIGGTRSARLSFNQWLDCKKFEASRFYMKHSDYYLGF